MMRGTVGAPRDQAGMDHSKPTGEGGTMYGL